ncbi:MAG: ImmA/IrrE family metallo-endopeptidase, partial [Verrucomicrobiae bacterium]|nr:ImmA/IrrE family metallo-endopeptidase [Verrucomicrobiae bacterium]
VVALQFPLRQIEFLVVLSLADAALVFLVPVAPALLVFVPVPSALVFFVSVPVVLLLIPVGLVGILLVLAFPVPALVVVVPLTTAQFEQQPQQQQFPERQFRVLGIGLKPEPLRSRALPFVRRLSNKESIRSVLTLRNFRLPGISALPPVMSFSQGIPEPTVGRISDLPAPQATGWTKQSIDDFAAKVAEELDYQPGTSLKPLIEKIGGKIVLGPVPDTGTTGYIEVKGPAQFTIALSPLPGDYRNRFTIAHELGHYILHSKIGAVPLFATRQAGSRAEWEANWFAAAFLMPANAFVDAWRESNGSIGRLINRFNVSGGAVEIRQKTLRDFGKLG